MVQVRAGVEGLRLGPGVLDKLALEGERASLRWVVFSILRQLTDFR